jgi:hypothetical protein
MYRGEYTLVGIEPERAGAATHEGVRALYAGRGILQHYLA